VTSRWLGLIELCLVLGVAVGWGLLELAALRLDRRKSERKSREAPRER
jgi:hypothetical protein